MSYIDGFLIPVPTDKREAYKEMAARVAPVFREHGAQGIVECWGSDIPHGKVNDFYTAVIAKEDENVVFSWVVWPSKEARDEGNKKIMEDPRLKDMSDMPFDGKRMIFGGFEILLDIGGTSAET